MGTAIDAKTATDHSALARNYAKTGVLVIEEFFCPELIAEIEGQLAQYIDQMAQTGADKSAVYEPGAEKKLRNLFHMHEYSEYFAKLAEDPRLTDLARALVGDEPISMGVELFGKPARVGSEVPFHQDNAYFNLVPDDALTVWVALADVTEANGCVRYLEGSHKLGDLPHRASGVKGNSMMLSEVPESSWREICGLVARGGAVIHHCNTIHRSEPNRSDRDRPGLLFVFKSIRCQVDAMRASAYRENLQAGA